MDDKTIISKINELLYSATERLAAWLSKMLPRISDDWWEENVIANLTDSQIRIIEERSYSKIEELDFAMLLRIANKSWYDMRTFAYLPTSDRDIVRAMVKVRNNWAHCSADIPAKEIIYDDIHTIKDFFENVILTNDYSKDIETFLSDLNDYNAASSSEDITRDTIVQEPIITPTSEIKELDKVYLVGEPDTKGMVYKVSEINNKKRYDVFVAGDIRPFYEGQIIKIDDTPKYRWVDINTFQSNITAYEINNPSAGNLYSLNAARIDFVPYQFRPALKLIKSDMPRILIADSVGVGKTIEAGLIIKELEARSELDNVLIICPKPLVAERKWELEMKRFDEEFTPLDGTALRQVISDTNRDGEWPSRLNKVIIPYSILDSRVFEGETHGRSKKYGLLDLDPAPHFDLVIIDEAHHLRNGSMEKDKAFAYKCVRYFCEHADAVVMLTATPLQTSNDDLYTLLNLLRPDVVMDHETFNSMSRTNEYIYRATHAVRSANEGWQYEAIDELKGITATQWGANVIAKNPLYNSILERLNAEMFTREERVKLISDIEALHSFNTLLNRTRRRDIQDFCVRRSFTIETNFTPLQYRLHTELLHFEFEALSRLYAIRSIPFMMSSIRRQAASCIFGLAPYIRDIINRRFVQISDEPDFDVDDLEGTAATSLQELAKHVLELADNLSPDDPKFDSVLQIVLEKIKQENNKVILFSTFRHTLAYLHKKFNNAGIRVAQIDGSVKDESRRELRERFELPKEDSEAIDLLLFTEVGSEGLDYQFCDTMINYDLPWNPMRIEQRIGRIDRRGQQSPAVSIYNIITADTVDADIYSRCLMRIGIFERNIGECEEVLGEISSQVEKIALNINLTDEERRQKLEQIADNEVRKMQELTKLENEEKALFGFDLTNYTTAREIRDAESPWISPLNIQKLVERYLSARLGVGSYVIGSSDLKQIRLSKDDRVILREDFRKLSSIKSAQKRMWENYLKGSESKHKITFLSETASKERKAFFITPMHPLVKQAARYFATNEVSYIHLKYTDDSLPSGTYPFAVYAWSYVGLNPRFKVVSICENETIASNLNDILQQADTTSDEVSFTAGTWSALEGEHIRLWELEKEKYLQTVRSTATFKIESISSNYRNRKRLLEQKILDAFEPKIKRMYEGELNTATENYEHKINEINSNIARADIHTILIAKGILEIKGE